jgi:cyclophilin family peptidyl-prolyl cis-trans isomerase
VVFHRVIDGFMAQTGDVEFGRLGMDMRYAGRGGSQFEDLPAEFSDIPYERGIVGMARAQIPDSANSQFFIMFGPPRRSMASTRSWARSSPGWRSWTRSSAARDAMVPWWGNPTA